MRSKGFISLTFLIIFLNVISLVTVIQYSTYKTLEIIDEFKEINHNFIIEMNVINLLRCELLNDNLQPFYYLNEYDLEIEFNENNLTVYCSSLEYPLNIEIKNNKIYDYY